jgi:hypothetical protein
METTPDYSGKQTKSMYILFDQIIVFFNVKVATVVTDL